MLSDFADNPGLALASVEGALLDLSGVVQVAAGSLKGLAEDGPDVVGILASVPRLGGVDDGPQLALASLVVRSDPHIVMGVIVSDSHILSVGDSPDSIGVAFSLESEPLVGSSVEAVNNQIAKVGHVLGNV